MAFSFSLPVVLFTSVFVDFMFVIVFVAPIPSKSSPSSIESWCTQTPYPETCEYFLLHNPKYGYGYPIKGKSGFLNMTLDIALEQAVHAKENIYNLGSKCRNEREKAAWTHCLELYENTILNINETAYSKCSAFDAQTWLSTALTNLQTCKEGFIDLGVADYLVPLMSNNLSYLICNTLSLNEVEHGEPSYKEGFPTWVTPGDRKLLQSSSPKPDVVVAQDGSGNFQMVGEAIAASAKLAGSARYVIYVKAGTYKENVEIGTPFIMMVGDGIGKTIITGSMSVGGGATTYSSATVKVSGRGFIGRGITFRNTAGPQNHQAVALRSDSHLSVFYQCSFEGYQDTLYVHSGTQFYRECDVYGTVDFIFGYAAVVFQNCNLYLRNPPNKENTITAQGRMCPFQKAGISIHNSRVTAASDLKPVQSSVKSYLGRPWQQYSQTVFMKTFLDDLIDPAGWLPWNDTNFALDTCYYGEYNNTGPGSSTANRVNWKGYHVLTSIEALKFTVGNFIGGDSWLPGTNVPFTSGV